MATENTAQDPTPDHVAELANEPARLPRLALLGTFGRESAMAALIRMPSGQTRRVVTGDRIGNRDVVAIDAARVILSQNGQTRVLTLPNS